MSLTPEQNSVFLVTHSLMARGRAAFFDSEDASLPSAESEQVRQDDRTPQFGFVGPNYVFGGLLVVGINPGLGGRLDRNAIDNRMMPALHAFRSNPIEANFEQSIVAQMESFPFITAGKDLSEDLGRASLGVSEISYTNALPYRAGNGSSGAAFPNLKRKRKAAEAWLYPLLQAIKPDFIVAHGRTAFDVLSMINHSIPILVYNRNKIWQDRMQANVNFSSEFSSLTSRLALGHR